MIACLENIIGLTDKDCTCFDGQKPVDFVDVNSTESGLYITDGGIDILQGVFESIDCRDESNIYTVLAAIREKAITRIEVDLPAALVNMLSPTVFPFSGQIGQRAFTNSSTVGTGVAGIQLRPQMLRSTTLTINKIHVGFLANSSFDLTVQSNNEDFTTTTVALTGTGGQFTANTLETAISIPFYAEGYEELRYFFSYAADGIRPLNNVFKCCGNRKPWARHINAGGFQAQSVNLNYDHNGNQANGLVLEGFISCDTLAWVCDLTELGGRDFKNVLASTVVHKATEMLANYILDSQNITSYTLLNREALYGKRNAAKKNYETTINWIASNLPNNVTDCYTCKPGLLRRTSL